MDSAIGWTLGALIVAWIVRKTIVSLHEQQVRSRQTWVLDADRQTILDFKRMRLSASRLVPHAGSTYYEFEVRRTDGPRWEHRLTHDSWKARLDALEGYLNKSGDLSASGDMRDEFKGLTGGVSWKAWQEHRAKEDAAQAAGHPEESEEWCPSGKGA